MGAASGRAFTITTAANAASASTAQRRKVDIVPSCRVNVCGCGGLALAALTYPRAAERQARLPITSTTTMSHTIDSAVESLHDDLVALIQALVRTPSISGDERAVQRVVEDVYAKMGLEVERIVATRELLAAHPAFSDDGLGFTDRTSLVARWRGTGGGRSIILNGHVDVVPPGDLAAWRDDPWSGTLRDGRIIGRGSCDMKAGVSATVIAVRALQMIGFRPKGDVILESVAAEETGGIGTLSTIVSGVRADACVIAEPTGLALWTAQAGALTFRITVDGRAAHAAMKSKGVSAVVAFMPLLAMLERLDVQRHQRFRHSLFPDPTNVAPINIGVVRAGDWPSTVPDKLIAEGRLGVFPGESTTDARAALTSALADEAARHPWLCDHPPQLEWFEGQFDSAEIPRDADIVKALERAHEQTTSTPATLAGVSAGTDARLFTRYANVPTVLYGPGDINLAHAANEYVLVDEVVACAKTLARVVVEWCGG